MLVKALQAVVCIVCRARHTVHTTGEFKKATITITVCKYKYESDQAIADK